MKKQLYLSVVNQATNSAFQFFISIYMIRTWSMEEFGVYSIIFTIGLLIVGIQNALINTPYSVGMNYDSLKESWTDIVESLYFINLLIILVSFLISFFIVYVYFGPLTGFVCGFYFSSILLKEFIKNKRITDGDVSTVTSNELFIIISASIFIYAIYFFKIEINLISILLVMSVTNALCYFRLIDDDVKLIKKMFNYEKHIYNYIKFTWSDSQWSLIGMITTEMQSRGYVFIISLWFGPSSVGIIQSAKILFSPLNLIVGAWGRIVRPRLALYYNNNELVFFKSLIFSALIGFLVFNIIYSGTIYLMWDLISEIIYGAKNGSDSFYLLVVFWAVYTLALHLRNVLSVATQSIKMFKHLAHSTITSALFTLIVSLMMLYFNDYIPMIIPMILGEIVAIIYIKNICMKKIVVI